MTLLTFEAALAAERQREEVRFAAHVARIEEQRFSLYGVQPLPYMPRTEADLEARARAAMERFNAPEAVLKRALLAAADAGSREAERLYEAACRGSDGWERRAHELLAQREAA